jgi:hypothetical protein
VARDSSKAKEDSAAFFMFLNLCLAQRLSQERPKKYHRIDTDFPYSEVLPSKCSVSASASERR